MPLLVYRLVEQEGPIDKPIFTSETSMLKIIKNNCLFVCLFVLVAVYVGKKKLAVGTGSRHVVVVFCLFIYRFLFVA